MTDGLVIGVPATTADWRHDLHAWVTAHATAAEVVVLQDPSEIRSSGIDVLVVDDTADFMTQGQVLALSGQGVQVVGLAHDGVGRGRDWLAGRGISTVVSADTDAASLVALLSTVDEGQQQRPGRNGSRPAVPILAAGLNDRKAPNDRGSIVVVGGGSDSPGRTEVAACLANRLALRAPTVLVDLDETAPSVAARLGFAISPGLLDAVAALRTGSDLRECMARRLSLAQGRAPVHTDVLCGLPGPEGRGQLRDVAALLDTLASQWRWVVVDTSSYVADEAAVSRVAMTSADVLLAVCRGSPQGAVRLLAWLEYAQPRAPVTVVMNQTPNSRYYRTEMSGLITANVPRRLLAGMAWLDRDTAVEAASWNAEPPMRGRFVAGVENLARQLAPRPTRWLRDRLLRRAAA